MFSQQSTSESVEAGVPQIYYYNVHMGSNDNNNGMGDNPDGLTTTNCYDNDGNAAAATYVIQQHYHPVNMEHEVSAASVLPMSYENTLHINDICLAEKEIDQYPSVEEFDEIVQDYLNNLSTKKRDKALVDRHRYTLITRVLKDPRNTAISTAQFRFWVKKMFQFVLNYDGVQIVCHDKKPVAMREDIYGILVQAHKQANHGGRDKTSALVRRQYSWIPKELIARFVRHCPFCIARRNGSHSPSISLLPRTSAVYTAELPVANMTATTTDVAAAAAGFSEQEMGYHTDPTSSIEGLPYLAVDFKHATNDRNFSIKWHEQQHHHHQAHGQQQQQQQHPSFHRPLQSPGGNATASPASSAAGPISVHSYPNVFYSTVTEPNAPSCAVTPCPSQETAEIYQHPTLPSLCGDMSAIHYGHVGQQPPPYSTCYASSPEISMDPLTIITPQLQFRQVQQQHRHHQSDGNSNSSPNDILIASYYASQQQDISYDQELTSTLAVESEQSQRQQTMVYPHTFSSPSPSSSFSSSSSYSTPSSPPVSPTPKQDTYMQHQQLQQQQHQQHHSSMTAPLFSNRSF